MKTTPIRIIGAGLEAERAWLEEHGYDGLYTPNDECGCYCHDLYPCGERGDRLTCVPGHEATGGIGPAQRGPRKMEFRR